MRSLTHSRKGQALILIVLTLVGLIGITALAVDGGNAFADKRHAQSAADAAVLAAALAKVHGDNMTTATLQLAADNGYNNDGVHSTVEVHNPPINTDCSAVAGTNPYLGNIEYVQVIIHSNTDTFFAPVIGVDQTQNCVEAIARVRLAQGGPLFNGAAVVGLDPSGSSFNSGSSNAAKWYITGGGIFANYNASSKNNNSVTFYGGGCVSAVHGLSGFGCSPQVINPSLQIAYPSGVIPLLPPIPLCTGTAYLGGDGKYHEQVGYEGKGSRKNGWPGDYAPGVYCIQSIGGNIHSSVTGTGVTFYVMDTSFTVKFNGGGYIAATAPSTGTYAGCCFSPT